MQYRRFGKTNLSLSVLSLGTMRYLASKEVACRTVERAIAAGINHIETARGYGASEVYLGQALKTLGLSRQQIYITTKAPPTVDAQQMAVQIDQSLERLGLDYVDCFAVHGINTPMHLDWVQQPDGCMAAVRQAMAAGKIRHLGFSTHGPLEVIVAAINTQQFEFVNLHYYFFHQHNAPAVELAHANDMGVFIISPADKGGQLYTPPQILSQLCQPFSPLELTYRFLLADQRVTTLSVGPATPKELDLPLRVCDRVDSLSSKELTALTRLVEHQRTVLATDQCSQCYACLPCPESIEIPEVLRLRNLAVAFDMTQFGQYRYRMFEQAGHWFPGRKAIHCTACGDCLPRCPEQLNIPALLKDTHKRLNGPARRRLWG